MDYTRYTVEDLASDGSFIQWAQGTNAEAVQFWEEFISQHPDMRMKISQARTLVLNLAKAEATFHSDQDVEQLWQRIDTRLEDTTITRKKTGFSMVLASVAMLCVLALALTWYLVREGNVDSPVASRSEQGSANDFVEEVNTSGNVLRIHMSDGSTVTLQNNSRLRFRKHYEGEENRVVYLTGEAFFDVAKNPAQPFFVHTNGVVTRVLGTSFWVSAPQEDGDVLVSVKTGKVSVYKVADGQADDVSQKNAVILLPNQQVVYQRDQEVFGKSLVPQPEVVMPSLEQEAIFNFEATPIKEVFGVLQNAYGIEIIFDEEVMRNCFITAPLGSEPLFDKLKVICRAIGARYEIIDAKVVITSTGC
jgi:ferric-dicitrate binding protein FerR (iron transport regulator)